jgi:hypothetical protein
MLKQVGIKKDYRLEVVKWLTNAKELGLTQGLTVMPKKVYYKHVPKSRYAVDGKVYRHLTKDELEKANTRLIHLINKLVLKNAYKRDGKKLVAVGSIEGDNSTCIDLHTHFLLQKPDSYTNEQFYELAFPRISRQIMMSKLKRSHANGTNQICRRVQVRGGQASYR